MVEGHADVHHGSDGDGVVADDWPFLDRLSGQNGRLGMVDYWLGNDRA